MGSDIPPYATVDKRRCECPKCHGCGRTFAEGDDAYVQEFREIEVHGRQTIHRDVEHIVCSDCAE